MTFFSDGLSSMSFSSAVRLVPMAAVAIACWVIITVESLVGLLIHRALSRHGISYREARGCATARIRRARTAPDNSLPVSTPQRSSPASAAASCPRKSGLLSYLSRRRSAGRSGPPPKRYRRLPPYQILPSLLPPTPATTTFRPSLLRLDKTARPLRAERASSHRVPGSLSHRVIEPWSDCVIENRRASLHARNPRPFPRPKGRDGRSIARWPDHSVAQLPQSPEAGAL